MRCNGFRGLNFALSGWDCVFGQLPTSPSLEEHVAEILDDHALPREPTVYRTQTVTASLMCTSRGSRGGGVVSLLLDESVDLLSGTTGGRCDNCPRVSNALQRDIDKDHIGDVSY